jgi:hypothetical protein
LQGEGGAEEEATGLDPQDHIDVVVLEGLGHRVDGVLVRLGVVENRGDVLERDARLGEVGDLDDVLLEFVTVHPGASSYRPGA